MTSEHWEARDSNNSTLIGTSKASKGSLLLGTHHWKMQNFNPDCPESANLSLSACNETEFTCDGGSCVSMKLRCDAKTDCEDESDEDSCDITVLPQGYLNSKIPRPKNSPLLVVNVSMTIKNFLAVDELKNSFTVAATFSRTWFDRQLKYKNIHEDETLNILTNEMHNKLWYPKLIFENQDKTQTSISSNTVYKVIKSNESKPTQAGPESLRNTYTFHGSENKLAREVDYMTSWKCAFDLRMYPFDTQVCRIELKNPDYYTKFVQLSAKSIRYLATGDELNEYKVGQIKFCSQGKNLVLDVVLERPLISSILTVFIPTLLLLVISHFSAVFENAYIDMVVPLHLTVLLVLASL